MGDKRNYILGTQYGTKGEEFNKLEQILLGLGSGGLKIFEAIAELGAGVSDYFLDTELLTSIEENFPKINVDDGVGKFVELMTQYAVPYGVATKAAGKLMGLKKLDALRKGTGVSGVAKKMGYYGALGLAVEPVVTTSRDKTLGQAFGITADPKISELTGRARAAATFKQKTLMGIEGAGVGAVLPVAGVAAKGALVGATKVAKPAAQALDFAVVNPLSTVLSKGAIGEYVTQPVFNTLTKSVAKAKEITKNTLGAKTLDEIRLTRNPENFIGRLQKTIANNLTTSGMVPKNAFDVKQVQSNVFRAKTKDLHNLSQNIDEAITNLAREHKDAKKGFIIDSLPKKEKWYADVGRAVDGDKPLSQLPKDLRRPVKELKDKYSELKKEITDLMTSKEVLNTKGLTLFKKTKIKDRVKALTTKSLQDVLSRGLHGSYAAFTMKDTFKIREPERVKAAVKEVKDFLKNHSKVKGNDAYFETQAKKQIDSFINQAEKSKNAAYFFDEALPNFLIRSKKRPRGKITFMDLTDAKYRQFKTRGLTDSLSSLLGKGGVKESIFDTNIFLAEMVAKKRMINEIFLFNKNTTKAGTKFIFQPNYSEIAKEQSKLLGKPIRINSAKSDLTKATNDVYANDVIQQNLENQFKKQYPNIEPPNFKNMGEEFKRAGVSDDPFGYYKYMPDHYVPENIHEALLGEVAGWSVLLDHVPFYKGFLGLKGLTQAGKTVFSPTTQVRNFTSASFFALHNGHIGRPFGGAEHTFADIVKAHIDEVFPSGKITKENVKKVLGEKRTRAIELGVTQSNIAMREIDDLLEDVVSGQSRYATTTALFKKITQSASFKKSQELYTKGDDIWKDYGWRFTQSQLKEALPEGKNFVKDVDELYFEVFGKQFNHLNADGSIKTYMETLEEISAQYVKNTYPNYNYVPKFVRDIRRLPLGNFISFPAEILRTSANLMKFAAKEMASSNPVVRKMGAKRMIGQTIGLSSGAVLSTASLSALGMNQEQYESFKETQVPEWNKFGDLIMLSKKEDTNGNIVYRYIPFSYQNPYAYLQAPFYAFSGEMAVGKKLGRDWDDRMMRSLMSSVGETLRPFVSEAILSERLLDVTTRGGQTLRRSRVWPNDENTPIGDKVYAGFGHLLEGIEPGIFTQATKLTQAVAEEKTPYGKQFKLGDEALALFAGVRIYDADLNNNLNFKYNTFKATDRSIAATAKGRFFAENATTNTRINSYQTYLENSYRNFNSLKKLTDDLEKLGLSPQYIQKFLKDRKAEKNIRASVKQNRFVPPSFETFYNDGRFIKLAKKLGVSRSSLFPRGELREIYNNFRYRDLFQSINSVRSQIREENKPKESSANIQTQNIVQGQGTTAGGSPLRTPPAQVTGIAQPLGGLNSANLRQRLMRDDELLKDFA
tara:strand:+ start:2466 stop:6656 length:4191 start_codon:yes stop_codon:yes gene_type:complete